MAKKKNWPALLIYKRYLFFESHDSKHFLPPGTKTSFDLGHLMNSHPMLNKDERERLALHRWTENVSSRTFQNVDTLVCIVVGPLYGGE